MDILSFSSALASLMGAILLAIGFQTQKTDAEGWTINGKYGIVLKYQNPLLIKLGWFFIIIGFILQIIMTLK